MQVYASAWSDRGRIPLPHYRSDGPNGAPRFPLSAPYGSKAKPPVLQLAALLRSRSALLSVRPKSVAQYFVLNSLDIARLWFA